MTEDRASYELGQNIWLIRGQELHLDTPLIMGILNVTPDSFSDGGQFIDPSKAIARAHAMLSEGADIIDVGGESTRPGSLPVDAIEEISRVVPVIEELTSHADVIISIDTQKSSVAKAALDAGAHIVNDVSAGGGDHEMFELVSASGAGYILMHMQGKPETMQDAPAYGDVLEEVNEYFFERLQAATKAGIAGRQIVFDPGIGFGKTLSDNLKLIGNIHSMTELMRPIMLGASRKSFIGLIDNSPIDKRLGGSLAAVISAHQQGVRLFRVHDVAETRQVLDIFTAIQKHSD
ncbi:MAG: dihydropteroate synthase [Candidatus Marinimicrobia bacterium]|jgi:dihydropteroate synthase|nr:dihydropteroate synthase [Candidatus Neomarinimicrobiota bacterium]MBT3574889.1 dihydropteroate synthase [Candidatus Neomarinimicrobiota bacterium]MBT3679728.1 dihydropteroate synthase [Candidatus Neomarinimicrobiota bacterium]MBT3950831.1 dihydropteroate synthase [Candidatus Neomarinimicrobiota bacterium]MBT4252422.1 dihydropteroate synthase [Candidatus Neomarinimicrobiota bacterium]